MGVSTKMTESLFTAGKILLENDATWDEVAKYLKISKWTVANIANAETFEEYKAIVTARNAKNKAKIKAKKLEEVQKAAEAVGAVPASQIVPPAPAEPPVQVIEHRQSVTIGATHYMHELLKEQNDILKGISAKLAFIVDELCGVKKPEGGD